MTDVKPTKDMLLKRLNRSEGQIRGISRMIAADAPYLEVLTQISAVQAALDKVGLSLLRDAANSANSDELVTGIKRLLNR